MLSTWLMASMAYSADFPAYFSAQWVCSRNNNHDLALWCFTIIVNILPYSLLKLVVFGRRYKVFMGDAGNTMIGFTIIWLLLQSTQGWGHLMKPVTALWIIAVLLMDIMVILYRRISNK